MTIADKVRRAKTDLDEVHAAGVEEGKALGGYTEGYEDGKQAEYDAFWDVYQTEGGRRDYQYGAFSGRGWTDQTFKPKYPIIARDVYGMFQGTFIAEVKDIDFSPATTFNNVFAYSTRVLKIGEINIPKSTRMDATFIGCTQLHTIDKIIVGENCTFASTFNSCSALRNVVFDGVIGNSISFSACTKLTKDSITSIINHLSDTVSGNKLTLSKTAVWDAFTYIWVDPETGEEHDMGYATSDEWNALEASKPNWTISLV